MHGLPGLGGDPEAGEGPQQQGSTLNRRQSNSRYILWTVFPEILQNKLLTYMYTYWIKWLIEESFGSFGQLICVLTMLWFQRANLSCLASDQTTNFFNTNTWNWLGVISKSFCLTFSDCWEFIQGVRMIIQRLLILLIGYY